RSSIVNEKMFADLARKLNLGDFLLLGKGEDSTEGRNKNSILADTYEALIASIYLDRGFNSVFKVVIKHFTEILSAAVQGNLSHEDFKSKLQEYAQSVLKSTPQYISVNVTLNKKLLGTGFGKSKKDAAQNAAKEALEKLSKVSEDD
ncbi:MAG: ribonuclease III, partial [Deltaproteobacteria bacterium]|nr:ribonuclease III [Deltaproteobacteria bacterium]